MCRPVHMKCVTFEKIIQKVRGKNFIWVKEVSGGAMRELGERQEKRKKAEHFLRLIKMWGIGFQDYNFAQKVETPFRPVRLKRAVQFSLFTVHIIKNTFVVQ